LSQFFFSIVQNLNLILLFYNFGSKAISNIFLLITPPFTQLNTPYPATAYIKGFLNTLDVDSFQVDLGLEVILALFSEEGLQNIFDEIEENRIHTSKYYLKYLHFFY
jgi:hypothetical protein